MEPSKISVFDIIGPVMVGPSSSHTAGAVRIGNEFSKVLCGRLERVEITLFNSFADTGTGHGTRTAIVAGILGLSTEDEKIRGAIDFAAQAGVHIAFHNAYDPDRHPNSALIYAQTTLGTFCGFGESVGGGMINFRQIRTEAELIETFA
ncbi:MAG TPA: hypothetical protein HA254_02120 [Candidatus Diapherotrites archaeon]|uniref:Serine dehydratase beta chain domain-containing protein n=1 Tax=Candidatus Iainarchaeum sp. TaxID=3101447 RepID=A0A7J4IVF9_9ARCH|nr:hypothetical protein [Candidatus Diapherotrites archaeon]